MEPRIETDTYLMDLRQPMAHKVGWMPGRSSTGDGGYLILLYLVGCNVIRVKKYD